MMVDIGRGAVYLEANNHVHRDLAARNCLISSRNSHSRITKIGIFMFGKKSGCCPIVSILIHPIWN